MQNPNMMMTNQQKKKHFIRSISFLIPSQHLYVERSTIKVRRSKKAANDDELISHIIVESDSNICIIISAERNFFFSFCVFGISHLPVSML
jgi:hypothetical protein